MSPDETRPTPAPQAETGSGDPFESFISYFTQNWKELLTGLVIAAVILVSLKIYQNKKTIAREQAFNQLAAATSGDQLSEIVSQFPGSKAAELARFMAARSQYDQGNYAEADKLYAEFLDENPDHFMASAASLGRIHCQEATGQAEQALESYRQFATAHPAESGLVVMARLGEARCLRQMGKLQEAVAVYETILLEQPQSDWKPLVEDLKNTTAKDVERMNRPMAPEKPAA